MIDNYAVESSIFIPALEPIAPWKNTASFIETSRTLPSTYLAFFFSFSKNLALKLILGRKIQTVHRQATAVTIATIWSEFVAFVNHSKTYILRSTRDRSITLSLKIVDVFLPWHLSWHQALVLIIGLPLPQESTRFTVFTSGKSRRYFRGQCNWLHDLLSSGDMGRVGHVLLRASTAEAPEWDNHPRRHE